MLIKVQTQKTIHEAALSLQAAVEANHFGVLEIHDLKEAMAKRGIRFDTECLMFEVYQPAITKKVLEEDMIFSAALPCRISVYKEAEQTVLAALKPTAMLAMFNTPKLAGAAQEVEFSLVKIMKEAANYPLYSGSDADKTLCGWKLA